MEWFNDIGENPKKKIYIGVFIVCLLITLICFFGIKKFNSNQQKQTITVERVTGKYQLVSSKGPSPLLITVKELNTGTVYEDSFVSVSCPQYGTKAVAGNELELTRFTNIRISDEIREYFFKGAYEQLCTNIKFNPKSGDNYFKGN